MFSLVLIRISSFDDLWERFAALGAADQPDGM
jgi:hypothetical protein